MNFQEYQDRALQTRQTPAIETEDPVVPLLGLAGEVGELASEYKKVSPRWRGTWLVPSTHRGGNG